LRVRVVPARLSGGRPVDCGHELGQHEFLRAWQSEGRVRERLGVDTVLAKVLVIFGERQPGRTTVVLVREPVGV